MKSRDELKRDYQQRLKPAGVFQIKNTVSGKVLLGSSLNLEGPLNAHQFMLKIGSHRNQALQRDWNEHGAAAFVFEILDVVKESDEPGFDRAAALAVLEELWIEELQPFGERGYNTDARIRQA
ncbi:MAG TPA: GIY-YIG nuclease family protein [Herpetosiphonaceae bacterium]